jgi:hypothetical protein
LEEARSINASSGFFIALPMQEVTRFIHHTDPTPVGANVNQAVISRTPAAAIFFRPPDGPLCFCGGLTLSPLSRSQFRARAIAQKKRPQRGGAGAVTVGVTYAEGVGIFIVNAPPGKTFPSRPGDPVPASTARQAFAAKRRGSESGPAGTFRYATGTF